MRTHKNLGIWMDYSSADLIEPNGKNRIIQSELSSALKEEAFKKGEKHMHQKEQHLQEKYFKEIGNHILKYDHVLLFGSTNAKLEFHHYLNGETRFKHVKIAIESADKMTENKKKALVKKYFNA